MPTNPPSEDSPVVTPAHSPVLSPLSPEQLRIPSPLKAPPPPQTPEPEEESEEELEEELEPEQEVPPPEHEDNKPKDNNEGYYYPPSLSATTISDLLLSVSCAGCSLYQSQDQERLIEMM